MFYTLVFGRVLWNYTEVLEETSLRVSHSAKYWGASTFLRVLGSVLRQAVSSVPHFITAETHRRYARDSLEAKKIHDTTDLLSACSDYSHDRIKMQEKTGAGGSRLALGECSNRTQNL
jgi:hypothetical protein